MTTTVKMTLTRANMRTVMTTEAKARRGRRLSERLAPVVLVTLLAAACGSSGLQSSAGAAEPSSTQEAAVRSTESSTATQTSTSTSTSVVVAPVTTQPAGAEPAGALAAGTVAVSPTGALVDVLGSLGDTYTFVSDITTQSGDRVVVVGSRVADGLTYRLEAGGASVAVIVVAGESWILEDGASQWVAAGQAGSGDPLGPLGEPVEVSLDPSDPALLHATYSSSALGLEGSGTLDVQISFDDTSVSFTSVSQSVLLVTTLTRSDTLEPIVAPV